MFTSKVTSRHIAIVLESFPVVFLAVPLGRLYYRATEKFKTEALMEHKGNFDEIVTIPKLGLDDILWWQIKIPSSFAPFVRENPSITINIDASSFGWRECTDNRRNEGQFHLEERELHIINTLELKAALYGLRSFCDSVYKTLTFCSNLTTPLQLLLSIKRVVPDLQIWIMLYVRCDIVSTKNVRNLFLLSSK